MKPLLPTPAASSTAFRRFVRALTFVLPAFFTSLSFAEPWTATDIGNTGASGFEANPPYHLPPDLTMTGSGTDIYGTADSFRFMHTSFTGDVVAVTRVGYMSSGHAWAKAGVVIRASLAPNAPNVAMVLSPGQPSSFQVRATTGAATDVTLGARASLPYWVKLTRTGDTFTGYISADGTTWTQVGSRVVAMPAQVYAGFAVCSHAAGTQLTADFDQADINGSSTPPIAPSNLTAPNPDPYSVGITWADNSTNEDGFRVYVWRSERHATYPELYGVVPANATSYTITGLSPENSYYAYVTSFRGAAETQSDTISIYTPHDPSRPPPTPDMGSVVAWAPNQIGVGWNQDSLTNYGYNTGFELERSAEGSPFARIATLGANAGGYLDTGLTNGTTYSYRVRAMKDGLYSAYSAVGAAQAMDKPVAPTGLAIGSLTSSSLQLTWTDNSSNETRFYIERSAGGGEFRTVGNVNANTPSYTDLRVSPNNTYVYRVRAFHSFGSDYSNVVTVTTPGDGEPPLPSGWAGADIGSPFLGGFESGQPPSFTMQAAGADIQGTADSFRYLSQTVNGDATVIARVASLTNTNSWAKAGVMIRASLAPDAANAAMLLSPGQVCSFQTRVTTGATTSATLGPWVTPPYWVKLTRVGNTFTGYVSPNGVAWTQVGSSTIVLPAQVHIGFAATSHNVNARTTASFDHAEVTGSTTPPPPPPTWTQRNWGTATGSFTPASGSDSVASLTTTSGDIYGTSDSGVFVYRTWSGAATFITRVNAVGNSDAWAKAGLMFRASLESNSANAFVALTPAGGAVFQSRPNQNGALTTQVSRNWGPRPGFLLKLVRGGGTITASFSGDNGLSWAPLGSVTDDLPENIYFGYAAASHNTNASTTATFAQPE